MVDLLLFDVLAVYLYHLILRLNSLIMVIWVDLGNMRWPQTDSLSLWRLFLSLLRGWVQFL